MQIVRGLHKSSPNGFTHPRGPQVTAANYVSTSSSLPLAHPFQKIPLLTPANEIVQLVGLWFDRSCVTIFWVILATGCACYMRHLAC